jgi:protein TonB
VKTILNRRIFRSLLPVLLGVLLSAGALLAQDGPVRVGGNVVAANRISWVNPVYPAGAKQNRIEGTVKLEVLIDKDGHVANVTVTSGPAELTESASDAVSQWVYRPTLLNGKPVSVLTTVDVNFTLSQ